MQFLPSAFGILANLDVHLEALMASASLWAYVIVFLVILCETGLVIAPFLPGETLLFALGSLSAGTALQLWILFPLLSLAAVCGDALNYAIGAWLGPHFFERYKLLKHEHLERAHAFYERHGGKAVVFARFLPIIRTVVPFVAGMAKMTYPRFALYNITGGIAWVTLFLFGGFFFGKIPMVEKNFSLVILMIIVISVLPAVIEGLRQWRGKRAQGYEK